MVNGAVTSYELNLHCNSATAYIMKISRWLSGAQSVLLNNVPIAVAPAVGSTHTLTLRMRGNQITALWDNKVNLRINNADIIAAGAAGLGATAVTSTTGMHIDSIVATSPPPAEDQTLPTSFNPARNDTVAVGDSITDNWSGFDYQPYMGSSYLPLLTVQTMQRIKYLGIYATGGITAAKMRDLHLPQVLALNPAPGACILFCGTNDTGVVDRLWNLSYMKAVLKEMARSLMNAGIAPILVTIPPHDDFTAYTANSEEWNSYVRQFVIQHNLPLFDTDTAVTDPDNTYKTGYTTDGLHPTATGYEAMVNQAIADGLPNIFPVNDPTLLTARTTGDLTNIINDGTLNLGMFTTDTNADGVSDGFTTSGQTISRAITSGWSAGEPMVFSARVKTTSITSLAVGWSLTVQCTVPGGFTYPDGTSGTLVENGIVTWTFDANGLLSVQFTIPVGTTAVTARATLASGTVTYSRVTPAGGDALAGTWQQLRNNANGATVLIGEMTLRNMRGAAIRPLTAALTGAQKQSGTIAAAMKPPTALFTPPAFLSDTFTGTNGVLLENHTGEVGATWAKHGGFAGTFTIQANRIWSSSGEGHYYASGVPSSANYDVTTTIYAASNDTFSMAGAMGRAVAGATNTSYTAFAIWNGTDTRVYLKRWVAGTGTDISNVVITTPTVGTSHTLTLRMSGSSISALWDGVVVLGPITDTNISAAGRAGVISNGIGSTTTGWHIDTITAG
jgi:lysophospholipase L1-like esterase